MKQINKQVRQTAFVRGLHKQLPEDNPRLRSLTENDLHYLIKLIFVEIATHLREGHRVIFEGLISFFTKPVKRKCTNMHTGNTWYTLKRRFRTQPLDVMKAIAEVDVTEDEYELAKKK